MQEISVQLRPRDNEKQAAKMTTTSGSAIDGSPAHRAAVALQVGGQSYRRLSCCFCRPWVSVLKKKDNTKKGDSTENVSHGSWIFFMDFRSPLLWDQRGNSGDVLILCLTRDLSLEASKLPSLSTFSFYYIGGFGMCIIWVIALYLILWNGVSNAYALVGVGGRWWLSGRHTSASRLLLQRFIWPPLLSLLHDTRNLKVW